MQRGSREPFIKKAFTHTDPRMLVHDSDHELIAMVFQPMMSVARREFCAGVEILVSITSEDDVWRGGTFWEGRYDSTSLKYRRVEVENMYYPEVEPLLISAG